MEIYEPFRILQHSDGKVWIGTTTGLVIYSPATGSFQREPLTSIPRFNGRPPDISSIIEQPDRSIWIACHHEGVIRFSPDDAKFRFHEFDRELGDSSALHACETLLSFDKDHIAMTFAYQGIGVLDTRNMQLAKLTIRDTAGMDLSEVTALVTHANGVLHAVTISNGVTVLKYDGNDLTRLATYRDTRNPGNVFNDAAGDKDGNTWIATNTGLVKFGATDGSFQHFGPVDGFPLSSIESIMPDQDDRIIGSGANRVRFDPKTLTSTAEASGLYIRSIAVNGALAGIQAMDNAQAPLRLTHDRNSLIIEYAPIAMVRADQLRYEVRLEGHENDWIGNGTNRTVSYIGLPPGEYAFHVRISGKNTWQTQAHIAFTIVPAWWQTWWFRILAALLSGGLVFFVSRYILQLRYRHRIDALEREKEIGAVRTRIARDIHDDIGSGLTRITMLSREMNSPGEGTGEKARLAGSIANASAELIGQLSEIVWTVDPKNDDAEHFVAYVRDLLGRQFEELSVALRADLSIEPGMEQRDIPPDIKRNVVMILKETVSNALKHAGARTISVKLRIGTRELAMHVEDDGAGFDTSAERSRGNGLGNLRKRSGTIGGTLNVTSDAQGTRYALHVPLPSPTFMRDP